jgi:hypothetical protein
MPRRMPISGSERSLTWNRDVRQRLLDDAIRRDIHSCGKDPRRAADLERHRNANAFDELGKLRQSRLRRSAVRVIVATQDTEESAHLGQRLARRAANRLGRRRRKLRVAVERSARGDRLYEDLHQGRHEERDGEQLIRTACCHRRRRSPSFLPTTSFSRLRRPIRETDGAARGCRSFADKTTTHRPRLSRMLAALAALYLLGIGLASTGGLASLSNAVLNGSKFTWVLALRRVQSRR